MMLKPLINHLAGSLGYVITPKWREENLGLATLLKQLITRHAVDCVIDAGANEGQYRKFLRYEVEYEGLIMSYEPQRELARLLRAAAKDDSRWLIHELALGSAEGELTLNIMERNTFSSFLQPDNSATPQFSVPNRIKSQHQAVVQRLDAQNIPQPASRIFLKCDTQGFDMEVIKGASGILSRIAVLQMELGVTRIYSGLPPYFEVLASLDALGFQPAGFFPVSRNGNLSAIEFDCVLVNVRT